MIGLLQRVSSASVTVGGEVIASIGPGLLVLVGVQRDDTRREVARLLERLLAYRVFPDAEGRMNLSLDDTGGDLLLVPQFTLAADTHKGRRPSFTSAADPMTGEALFEEMNVLAQQRCPGAGAGRFGADMQVSLINDGPVTFWLEVRARSG